MINNKSVLKTLITVSLWSFLFTVPAGMAQEPRPVAVKTAAVLNELVAPAMWVPGTVISRQDSRISAEVSGNLVWVAEVGDRFNEGDILARINDHELQLQLRNNRSVEKRLSARLEFLQRQVVRLGWMRKTNSTAESELDRLTVERDMLIQDLQAAKVAIDRTLYDIERTSIAAPFAGVVVERMQQPGEYLARADEVVRLVNTDALEIRVQAPLNIARHVSAGDRVDVKSSNELINTKVRTVVPVGDENSRMLQLRLELKHVNWLIGEAVRVSLNNGTEVLTLTVPRDALVLRNGETYLFTVQEDSTARRVNVVPGEGNVINISVQGDLNLGDKVIIRGAERLQDGSLIKVINDNVAFFK
jgi:RND family efflux transporter MFP subunit